MRRFVISLAGNQQAHHLPSFQVADFLLLYDMIIMEMEVSECHLDSGSERIHLSRSQSTATRPLEIYSCNNFSKFPGVEIQASNSGDSMEGTSPALTETAGAAASAGAFLPERAFEMKYKDA